MCIRHFTKSKTIEGLHIVSLLCNLYLEKLVDVFVMFFSANYPTEQWLSVKLLRDLLENGCVFLKVDQLW